jgi:CDP-diacylglycerol pyrophosphatase
LEAHFGTKPQFGDESKRCDVGSSGDAIKRSGGRPGPALALTFAVALAASSRPAEADPNALWRIVHDGCVPHVEAGQGPSPCETVDLAHGPAEGVAILKDLRGVAQMLAIPTRRISGIEDPQMLAPDAPPVFADGWKAKTLIEARLGGEPLPREAIALAINSKWARSQEQFHVHVDCVAIDVAKTLKDYGSALDDRWRPMTVPLAGRTYFARRLDSADLSDREPLLSLLDDGLPEAKHDLGAMSFAAVGANFDGKPGFILLADAFSTEGGGHAEDVQDHNCAIAHPRP